jgi:electron transfer flavoprotein beta subunit
MAMTLPGVVGVQSSSQPPRYIPISKVRQAMKTAHIEEVPAAELESVDGPAVSRMFRPEVGARAEMIEGNTRDVAARLVELFREQGIL